MKYLVTFIIWFIGLNLILAGWAYIDDGAAVGRPGIAIYVIVLAYFCTLPKIDDYVSKFLPRK